MKTKLDNDPASKSATDQEWDEWAEKEARLLNQEVERSLETECKSTEAGL